MVDKPKNREIIQLHFQHKEQKLREQLQRQAVENEKLTGEKAKLEEENRENFVFRLADESFPASDDVEEHFAMKELPLPYERFDYPVNESELLELKRQLNEKSLDVIKGEKALAAPPNNANHDSKEIGISCGQKIGSRVVLRSFHDRICDEPRGEQNFYHLRENDEDTCFTHDQWLDAMVNDPESLVC